MILAFSSIKFKRLVSKEMPTISKNSIFVKVDDEYG